MPDEIELSEREQEILRLVATGASNKEIALKLVISPNTVKVHLRNIFTKVGVSSRTEATLYAMRSGLMPAPALDRPAAPAAPTAAPETPPAETPAPIIEPRGRRPAWTALALLAALGLVALLAWLLGREQAAPAPSALAATTQAAPARWSPRAELPVGLSGAAGAVFENQIYVIGGESGAGVSAEVWAYDPAEDVWQPRAARPTATAFTQAALLGEKIYLPGGRLGDGAPSAALEIYDPRGDRWTRGADLPAALSGAALAAFEGRLYLFGGWDGQAETDGVYVYDPAADRWEARAALPAARSGAAAAVSGGKIVLAGGTAGGQPLDRVDAYAPARDLPGSSPWETLPALPQPRSGMAAAVIAERVYLAGGQSADGGALPVLSYSPQGEGWQALEQPPLPAGEAPLLLAHDTRLYLLGGRPAGSAPARSHLAYQAIYTVLFPVIR